MKRKNGISEFRPQEKTQLALSQYRISEPLTGILAQAYKKPMTVNETKAVKTAVKPKAKSVKRSDLAGASDGAVGGVNGGRQTTGQAAKDFGLAKMLVGNDGEKALGLGGKCDGRAKNGGSEGGQGGLELPTVRLKGEGGLAGNADGKALGLAETFAAIRAPTRTMIKIWKPILLESLRSVPNLTLACERAGITPRAIQMRVAKDPKFAAEIEAAKEVSLARLEGEIFRRATEGTSRPVWSKDRRGNPVKVDEIREYSDKAADMALRAYVPKYRPTIQQEISGPGGTPLALPASNVVVQIMIPPNAREEKPAIEVPAQGQIVDAQPNPDTFADDGTP